MNQPLTDQQLDLDAIETRSGAATPGPWERYAGYGPTFFANDSGEHLRGVGDFNFGVGEQADADEMFVRHARQDVDALLAEVHRLRDALTAIQRLHCDSPMGPCPVCIDADAAADGRDGLMPYPCPTGRLAGAQDCYPPWVRAAAIESDTGPCGHDDYHDPHEWADRPGVWCPGISHADDEPAGQ